jgi:uncharacterized protein (DUF305 family)
MIPAHHSSRSTAPRLVRLLVVLLFANLALSNCNARHNTDAHEQEAHGSGKPKPAPVTAPPSLRDTAQLLVQQLDTVRRIGCWDEDFARLMSVHHAGAQRLAAVEVSQGKDSTLRILAQHVMKGHERDNHVLTLALTRQPPSGQEYRPGNAKDPFVRRIAAALAPLRQLPPTPGPIDADFATLMQAHHQSGVALAQAELAFGRNAELKNAARQIVRDQQQEIKRYRRWLQTHPTLSE